MLAAVKNLIPFSGRTIGSDRITKFLSFALIVGLLQTLSWTYQIIEAPVSEAASTYAPSNGGESLTILSGIETLTITMLGGGGGTGATDGAGNTLRQPGARGKVVLVIKNPASGARFVFYPGNKGSNGATGTGNAGGSGGADTDPVWDFYGGNGGAAGINGSSGSGGGGGAATTLHYQAPGNSFTGLTAVAGGSGGGGGSANVSGSGSDGFSSNVSASGTNRYGANGTSMNSSCNNSNDGGGGGGGGGGLYGGDGGTLISHTSECSGNGGYRGRNWSDVLNSIYFSRVESTDSANNTANGSIDVVANLSTPSSISASATSNTYGSISVSWAAAPAARGFDVRLYDSNSNSLMSPKRVAAGTYSTTITSSDYSSIAHGTTYFVSVSAIGNSEAPYVNSPESAKFSATTLAPPGSTSDTDTAISFNGSSNQTASGPTAFNVFRDTFTVSSWVYPTSYGCKGGSPEANDDNCQILGKGTGFRLVIGSSSGSNEGKIGYYWNDYIYPYVTYSAYKLNLNEWHHVAFSREGSGSNQAKIYIDGNVVFQTTQSSSVIGNEFPFSVGVQNLSSSGIYSKFIGQIDEVKISSRARTQDEIKTDMQNHNISESSFTHYYDFNENTGSTVYNRIPNAAVSTNLTISGGGSFDSSKIFSIDTTTASAYTIIKFFRTFLVNSNGWRTPANISSIRYLVVGGGGGGGGGYNGGGGGAGGFRETNTAISPNTVYNIEIGAGGNGAFSTFGPTSGGGSTIRNNSNALDSITANGGGRGATEQQDMPGGPNAASDPDGRNSAGGSGGGGAHGATNSTTWGVTQSGAPGNIGGYSPSEGFAGGNGNSNSSDPCCAALAGGGGGGAGGTGGNASNNGISGSPGAGGIGRSTFITGTQLDLAGGGGGAGRYGNLSGAIIRGSSASHGGGAGAQNTTAEQSATFAGASGTVNTGGGGGGGGSIVGKASGGDGASGFVAIRYITSKPTIITQPTNDTSTAGAVDTFTISTSVAPAPLTKSVQWQFTADTTTAVVANITGWTNVTTGTGFNTDTFTTAALTKSMNKYRYRAIVTFSDTATISSIETSSVVTLTVNDSITITSDTSTITRKYGDTQTVRTIAYSGGTTSTGAVGTSTSHSVSRPFTSLSSGKITLDTSTSTARLIIDTRTAVGTYYETITVTDSRSATSSYTQKIVVTEADTLTITSGTPATLTYTGAQAIFDETITVTGLVKGDLVSGVTYNYSASSATCANGGLCNVGDIGPSGGYVFYVSPTVINVAAGISTGGIYLEAAPVSQQGTAEFGCTGTNTPGTSYSVGSGAANTLAIINACATAGIAARVTSNLTFAGYSDWFMPSLDEMTAIYNNLYRNTPSLGGFTGLDYGSSSQGTNGNGYQAYWWFGNGALSGQTNKNLPVAYRPVRAFNPTYTSSINYGPSTTKPTGAGTYTITPSALTFSDGALSNYIFVNYETSTLTINKARQDTLTITSKLAPYNGGTSRMKLTTTGGTDTGTVTYAIVSGGTATGCSIETSELIYTSAGTCRVVATKATTLNYLITYSDTVTITLSAFVSNQQQQTQSVPTQLPLNGANSLETTTVTAALLTITGVTNSGGGAYTIAGTGFTNVSVVRIGGTDLVLNTNYTVTSTTAISITNASGMVGPLFIYLSDGQQAVRFEFPN